MTNRVAAQEPVLMIHGLCCGGEVWTRISRSLRAAGWRVETPTICEKDRPITKPPVTLATLTLADYVADMATIARRLEGETGHRPVIVGHSMGGLIAQKLAEQQLARATVLLAPVAPANVVVTALAPVFTFANLLCTPGIKTRAIKVWRRGFEWGMLIACRRPDMRKYTGQPASARVLPCTMSSGRAATRIELPTLMKPELPDRS